MWALVKWVGGKDDEKYTVGIDVTHIKNFDSKAFLLDDSDPEKVYVIEWRTPKTKEPLGGWPCYHALVISISASKVSLEKKLKLINGIVSPGPKTPQPIKMDSLSDNESDIDDFHTSDGHLLEKSNLFHYDKELELMNKEVSDEDLADLPEGPRAPKIRKIALSHNLDTENELGVPGSGIFITNTQWAAAKSKDTWAAMLNSLLTSLFDEETLLASNYKGGKPKIKSNNPIS
ncbi:hypothetical protein KQX54_014495 [Cotesia glomerata]|uniref:Uncharacterized protein n=1 Tax=Cotesia glomerata TaxID=32391 RepID=A0AAV7J7Z9_COTGL|nr:hypothetical protein KQX54_014495 [Cotesia glomerata]